MPCFPSCKNNHRAALYLDRSRTFIDPAKSFRCHTPSIDFKGLLKPTVLALWHYNCMWVEANLYNLGGTTVFIKNRLGLTEATETMVAQEQRLNQIANNLANVNTNGYKKDDLTFWEMMFKAAGNRPRVGKGIKVIIDQSQGALQQTDNPLDFAISGRGFFKIQTPQGIRYTRNGNFTLNSGGQLSTADGNLVIGNGGPVSLNSEHVVVGRDGTISSGGQVIDRLALVDFSDQKGLIKVGNSLFKLKPGNRELQAGKAEIKQGYLEASNVSIVRGMTEMIDLQRSYQAQQKMIQTLDDLDHQAISRVGNLTG